MHYPLDEESRSLVKKHLSFESYKKLTHLTTSSGFTLDKAIQSGVANPDSNIGIYLGDTESYDLFAELLVPIIADYHGFSGEQNHIPDFSEVNLTDLDPDNLYIKSSRVRVARNLENYNFTCNLDLETRQRLESDVAIALQDLEGDLSGTYHSFTGETDAALLFTKGDRFQEAAGINSDFPHCRGIFYSSDERFRVWVNEEDHLRLISQASSSDLAAVFNHLGRALAALERGLSFARHQQFGYLTTCPTNLGTSMRAGVHIHLEKLGENRSLLNELVEKHQLQLRGTGGENTEVRDNIFDISNKRRLGLSEVEIITGLHRGLQAIIAAERGY